jgi:hypothetical protein
MCLEVDARGMVEFLGTLIEIPWTMNSCICILCESRRYQLDYNILYTKKKVKFSSILRMTENLSMVSDKNYNLNASEGFVILLTSKSILCFVDGFTLIMKSHSIAYLLNKSEHTYWILDLRGEAHSIYMGFVVKRPLFQECKGNVFFKVGRGRHQFSVRFKFFPGGAAPAPIRHPRKF